MLGSVGGRNEVVSERKFDIYAAISTEQDHTFSKNCGLMRQHPRVIHGGVSDRAHTHTNQLRVAICGYDWPT